MRRDGTPIQTLLLRTFLPAVVIVAMLLATLVYNWLYASIIDGFDRKLVTTSALAGAMIDAADHDLLMVRTAAGEDAAAIERSGEYRRNNDPMQRIQRALGLTYLYSQAFGGGQDIVYVLDGTMGDEHSPPGTQDDLTEETRVGLVRSERYGSVYVSPIEYQEQWGLLKTAAAPIFGANGGITSTAGADVNISVIQVATQKALFASALIGVCSIVACLIVALIIMRRVAGPIAALRQEALRIAAGETDEPARIAGPREVARLRDTLADLARGMAAAAAEAREAAAVRERSANAAILAGDLPPPRQDVLAQSVPEDRAAGTDPGASPTIDADSMWKMQALRRTAPFDVLTETELLAVARHMRPRRFETGAVLLADGDVADALFVIVAGEVLAQHGVSPAVFDAASALFGLPVRGRFQAGPGGAEALCLARPHLFTIARECPDFIVGLAAIQRGASA